MQSFSVTPFSTHYIRQRNKTISTLRGVLFTRLWRCSILIGRSSPRNVSIHLMSHLSVVGSSTSTQKQFQTWPPGVTIVLPFADSITHNPCHSPSSTVKYEPQKAQGEHNISLLSTCESKKKRIFFLSEERLSDNNSTADFLLEIARIVHICNWRKALN